MTYKFKIQQWIKIGWFYDIQYEARHLHGVSTHNRLAFLVADRWVAKNIKKSAKLSTDYITFTVSSLTEAIALVHVIDAAPDDAHYHQYLKETQTQLRNFIQETIERKRTDF